MIYSILLFVQSKEMPRKTRKQSRKSRRRTLRRIRKGGSTSQAHTIPTAAFGPKIGAPVNSADPWYN